MEAWCWTLTFLDVLVFMLTLRFRVPGFFPFVRGSTTVQRPLVELTKDLFVLYDLNFL